MTLHPNDDPAPPRTRHGRLRIAALSGVALLFVLRLALPSVLQLAIEDLGSQSLGVPVEIDELDLSLLAGEVVIEGLTVGGLTVGAVAATDDLLQLERLYVRASLFRSLGGTVQLEKAQFTAPRIRLQQLPDGRLSTSLLAQGTGAAQTTTTEQTTASSAGSTRVVIDHLGLTDLDLELRSTAAMDNSAITVEVPQLSLSAVALAGKSLEVAAVTLEKGRFDLGPADGKDGLGFEIDASAERVTNAAGRAFPVLIEAALQRPASTGPDPSIALRGDIVIDPLGFEGHIEYRTLPLVQLLAPFDVVPTGAEDWLRSGNASGELSIAIQPTPEDTRSVRMAGKLAVDDFSIANSLDDEDLEIALAWKSLTIELREALLHIGTDGAPAPAAEFRLAGLWLREPSGRFTQPSEALSGLLPEREEQPASATPATGLSIDYFQIENGSFEYIDHSTSPTFRDRIHGVEFEAHRIDPSTQTVEKLGLVASSRDATLEVSGSVGDQREITVDLERLEIAPFNTYTLARAGTIIDKGQLTLHSLVRREGEGVAAQTAVTVHDLGVREASAGSFEKRFGVSLPIGLALLRDINGDISLDVAFESSGEDSALNLGPIIVDALGAALLGAITSPLKLLYAVIPGDESSTSKQLVRCKPGSEEFTEESQEQIASLAELLSERPSLALSMRGQVGPLDGESSEARRGRDKLNTLARTRTAHLSALLAEKFGIATSQLRIEPQIPVGEPGVAIELLAR